MAERMGNRPPDDRMIDLLGVAPAERQRVLDVGCAGGRNTEWLVQHGHDVWAFDAAATMVAATRERVARHVGNEEAQKRVCQAVLEEEAAWRPDGHADFDLILALGVLQDLPDEAAFRSAVRRIAAALTPGGRVLVANFGPDSRPEGTPLSTIDGHDHVYLGFAKGGRRMTLPDLATLDAWFLDAGLVLDAQTTSSVRATDEGTRTTLNACYRRELKT